MHRFILECLFKLLKVNRSTSAIYADDIDGFVSAALGQSDTTILTQPEEAVQADVVVVDQHLEFVLGIDVIKRLRSHGFTGTCIIFTGSCSEVEIAKLHADDAVDLVISKASKSRPNGCKIRLALTSRKP